MKKLFFIFIFIFLITSVSAFSIEASPDELFLETSINQKVCKNVAIQVSEESNIIITDRWATKEYNQKILTEHQFSKDDIGITLSHNQNILIRNNKSIEICLSAKKEGFYHGVLLIKGEDQPVGIGVWINLNVTEKDALFTGLAIDKKGKDDFNITYLIPLIFIIIILIEVFILVKKRNH